MKKTPNIIIVVLVTVLLFGCNQQSQKITPQEAKKIA